MEQSMTLHDVADPTALFGPADRHLRAIKDLLGVQINFRHGHLRVLGSNDSVTRTISVINRLRELVRRNEVVTHEHVLTAVAETASGDASAPRDGGTAPADGAAPHRAPSLAVYANDRLVQPKTEGQRRYVEAIGQHDLTVCLGPAGTGKTYLAIAVAVSLLRTGRIKRIILVRPAVEAGEKLGYLPGDMMAKVNPFLRPLLDALHDMMEFDQLKRLLANDVVQIMPLAFMRGRTLNDACVIMDEAQNTTRSQMLMFLTRLGHGSKMIVTGDNTQIDLERPEMSGLIDAVRRLRQVQGVSVVTLTGRDIVRHPLVSAVVDAYAIDGIMPMS